MLFGNYEIRITLKHILWPTAGASGGESVISSLIQPDTTISSDGIGVSMITTVFLKYWAWWANLDDTFCTHIYPESTHRMSSLV